MQFPKYTTGYTNQYTLLKTYFYKSIINNLDSKDSKD